MEASMHGSFDESGKADEVSFNRHNTKVVVIPVLVAAAMVALAIARPEVSRWISEAAQAEFAVGPALEAAPTQFARPPNEMHLVKVN
jgi:hypothetical protein